VEPTALPHRCTDEIVSSLAQRRHINALYKSNKLHSTQLPEFNHAFSPEFNHEEVARWKSLLVKYAWCRTRRFEGCKASARALGKDMSVFRVSGSCRRRREAPSPASNKKSSSRATFQRQIAMHIKKNLFSLPTHIYKPVTKSCMRHSKSPSSNPAIYRRHLPT
jgi:hypothetical protein